MTVQGAIELAAPHTWPAAVLPVILGSSAAYGFGSRIDPFHFMLTLAAGVLLQSAVNTFNDFFDFISGLDDRSNCADSSDASIVYGKCTPDGAFLFGMVLLVLAGCCGLALIRRCGIDLVFYGALGLAAILLYAIPGISFSRYPLGELLSGTAMGGVLTMAAYRIQAGSADARIIAVSIPAVITVGCILLVNNTSDIEKDALSGRKTLSVLIGRRASVVLLRSSVAAAAVMTAVFTYLWFRAGLMVILCTPAAVICSRKAMGLIRSDVTPGPRSANMIGILELHKIIIFVYSAAILVSAASK